MPPKPDKGKGKRKRQSQERWITSPSESETNDKGGHKLRPKKRKNYDDQYANSKLKYHIKETWRSSEIGPQDVYFYFNVSFMPIVGQEKVKFENVHETLEALFQFVASKGEMNCDDDDDLKWNGISIGEMIEESSKNNEHINWIKNQDLLDFKTATEKQIKAYILFISDVNLNKMGPVFSTSAFQVYQKRYEFQEKLNTHDETILGEKSLAVKTFLAKIGWILDAGHFRYNGQCQETLELYIGNDRISDSSGFIDSRNVVIKVQPDSVFTSPPKITYPHLFLFDPVWRIVVEVYDPSREHILESQDGKVEYDEADTGFTGDDEMSIKSEDEGESSSHVSVENVLSSQISAEGVPITDLLFQGEPIRIPNVIADRSYRNCVTEHIKVIVPSPCREDRKTRQKLLGQHVMQLFAQIKKVAQSAHDEDLLKSIGMFMVNEYVYFSRLDVSSIVYKIVLGQKQVTDKSSVIDCHGPPQVRYSPFRLDITKRLDRLALLVFLRVYLYPNSVQDYDKTQLNSVSKVEQISGSWLEKVIEEEKKLNALKFCL